MILQVLLLYVWPTLAKPHVIIGEDKMANAVGINSTSLTLYNILYR